MADSLFTGKNKRRQFHEFSCAFLVLNVSACAGVEKAQASKGFVHPAAIIAYYTVLCKCLILHTHIQDKRKNKNLKTCQKLNFQGTYNTNVLSSINHLLTTDV
jgi:hypothetical protein